MTFVPTRLCEQETFANPEHPAYKFGTGTKETLGSQGPQLRNDLLRFWETYYNAPQMTLAVVSPYSADAVQASVEKLFLPIKSGPPDSAGAERTSAPPELAWRGIPSFRPPTPEAILAKPVAPSRSLKLSWILERPADRTSDVADVLGKPALIVSNLLGHEGPTSLLQFLKNQGLANGLTSGADYEASDMQTIEVQVSLTKKGLGAWEEVAALVLGYIALLRRTGIPGYFLGECIELANISWRFQERAGPGSYAERLATSMASLKSLGPARYLDGNRLFLDSTADNEGPSKGVSLATASSLSPLVAAFLARLSPSTARITVVAPEFETSGSPQRQFPVLSKRETWYDTAYATISTKRLLEKCGDSGGQKWLGSDGDKVARKLLPSSVMLPAPNKFIPSKFDFKATLITDDDIIAAAAATSAPWGLIGVRASIRDQIPQQRTIFSAAEVETELARPPELLESNSRWRCYYKQDKSFGLPRAYMTVLLATPVATSTVSEAVASKMWRFALSDYLACQVYDASLAGLTYDLDVTIRGIRLTLAGPDQTFPDFVAKVTKTVRSFDPGVSLGSGGKVAFERQKELLRREAASFDSQQPYKHAQYWESQILEDPHYSREELVDAIAAITLDQVSAQTKLIWSSKMVCQSLLQGNFAPSEAKSIFSTLSTTLSSTGGDLPWAEMPFKRLRLLPTEKEALGIIKGASLLPAEGLYPTLSRPAFNPANTNSAVEFTWQVPATSEAFGGSIEAFPGGPTSSELLFATASVFARLAEDKIFAALRTQQQLGYIVFSGLRVVDSVATFVIVVQSSQYDSALLHDRVAELIASFEKDVLAPMKPEAIAAATSALLEVRTEREQYLIQQVGRHWNEIQDGTYQWDRRARQARALAFVDKGLVTNFFRRFIARGGPERRALVVHVEANGPKPGPKAASVLDLGGAADLDSFRRELTFIPPCGNESRLG